MSKNDDPTQTAATKNDMDRARLLADEIEADGLLSVAEEDSDYQTDAHLIVLALRQLAGANR